MSTTTRPAGFYGTETESYYVTPAGRTWAFGSGDFDGVKEIAGLPDNTVSADGLITPEEATDVLGQIEAESGETLLEAAE
jgi:hypothetical protein